MTEAGYNLNYDVATKVMGWSVDLIVNPVGNNFEEWRDPSGKFYGSQSPPFSTEIEWAWKVVDHLMRTLDGPVFSLVAADTRWEAGFGHWAPGEVWIAHDADSEVADTAPLAICLAALKAVDSR